MVPITPREIRLILEAADGIGIHRESIVVQLAREGAGEVALLPNRKIAVTAPADIPVEAWTGPLAELIRSLDLRGVRTRDSEDD